VYDDGGCLLQRIEALEEGDDVDVAAPRFGVQLMQAGDPGQEEQVEDVVRGLGHADDERPRGADRGSL